MLACANASPSVVPFTLSSCGLQWSLSERYFLLLVFLSSCLLVFLSSCLLLFFSSSLLLFFSSSLFLSFFLFLHLVPVSGAFRPSHAACDGVSRKGILFSSSILLPSFLRHCWCIHGSSTFHSEFMWPAMKFPLSHLLSPLLSLLVSHFVPVSVLLAPFTSSSCVLPGKAFLSSLYLFVLNFSSIFYLSCFLPSSSFFSFFLFFFSFPFLFLFLCLIN